MFKPIQISGKNAMLMKPYKNPSYGSKTVLTDSAWEYVELFLERKTSAGSGDALFFWRQAHSFYLASQVLPDNSKPLTSYYCILNAAKALLRYNKVDINLLKKHGISSSRSEKTTPNLKDEYTKVQGGGVLPRFSKHYDFDMPVQSYSIYDLMYNIPCIHRAFCITYSCPEMLVPITKPEFVTKEKSTQTWLSFFVEDRYANKKALKNAPDRIERDLGVPDLPVYRFKKRFKWNIHAELDARKTKLKNYHKYVRKYLFYVHGNKRMWYLKKEMKGNDTLQFAPSSVLIFCVYHWLSEQVRYNPKRFEKYMKSKQNWLLHEFLANALDQFVDEISCEITGHDIMCTGYKK